PRPSLFPYTTLFRSGGRARHPDPDFAAQRSPGLRLGGARGVSAPARVRIMLADDHKLFRAGIFALVQTLRGIEIVAEAADGRERSEEHTSELQSPDH